MIISIHQPDYIPYLGYFYKIFKSDIFIFLDDVQFSNDNMHNWNKVKTPQGELKLKIPVEYKFGYKINQVRTKDELKWKEKHLKTIEMNYSKAKYFKEIYPSYKEVIMKDYDNIAEMNIAINMFVCKCLNINTKFVRSSEMNITSNKEERVIDICLEMKGKTYLSGNGARAYQNEDNFNQKGISLQYTDYDVFEYKQLWKEFIPNLSVIDYLFNCGYKNPFER